MWGHEQFMFLSSVVENLINRVLSSQKVQKVNVRQSLLQLYITKLIKKSQVSNNQIKNENTKCPISDKIKSTSVWLAIKNHQAFKEAGTMKHNENIINTINRDRNNPDDFKVVILNVFHMFRIVQELNISCRNTEDVKKDPHQSLAMETIMFEMENTLQVIKDRLDIVEDGIS